MKVSLDMCRWTGGPRPPASTPASTVRPSPLLSEGYLLDPFKDLWTIPLAVQRLYVRRLLAKCMFPTHPQLCICFGYWSHIDPRMFGVLAKCMGHRIICAFPGVPKCSCFCRDVGTLAFAFCGIDLSSDGMPDLPFTYCDLSFGGLEIFLRACAGV